MTISVLLCDDEPLARLRLNSLLAETDDVEIMGEVPDGLQAIAFIRERSPDVVLLDMEMPGLDGAGVVERLATGAVERPPLIIFVTAFSRFAVDAFECGAVDFLTKPVRRERLYQALARARQALAGREAQRRLAELTANLPRLRDDGQPDRIWVRHGQEQVGIPIDSIDRIVAEREYVRIYSGDRTWLHRSPLSAMEKTLAESNLLRVHRSHIVAPARVAAVQRTPNGEQVLIMTSGDRVPVSRNYRAALARIDRSLYREKP
ncbi:response regulator transcription factor [Sphingomonas panacisoli]|uniref:Response regulator transcription factor n=1 Tax=Sphingomonas panacisoli TaxID=1813879 RepID=A0A5B8LG05_9SPHN|nr:LytTR family DNA-binding domain-containing protein [Sphingomonas panacisoli]QDZ06582.1 response regulator transcription factor [Sphingomonas panacisoli]